MCDLRFGFLNASSQILEPYLASITQLYFRCVLATDAGCKLLIVIQRLAGRFQQRIDVWLRLNLTIDGDGKCD